MRFWIASLSLLALAPAVAQQPPAGVAVERVTLRPGDSASFTLAPGNHHELLVATDANAAGAITVSYAIDGGGATLTATSHAGAPLGFTVLGDRDGNGGFEPVGDVRLPNDGTVVTAHWPVAFRALNVGSFRASDG